MKKPLLPVLSAVLLIGACSTVSESRLNPFNWFGGSTEETLSVSEVPAAPVERRWLVDQVVSMQIERVPGGAIVRATGLPTEQGYWEADLVAENNAKPQDGTLVFSFRAFPPPTVGPAGTQASREITAAVFLSDQSLANVRTIVVRGAQNQRSSRR
ncbi:hypothetical protein [Actibacterium lipolyticum]|uniref:Lipoprotein n=1 Tax=Actibacterium lipolyticum TaxID=1524263 RepID=A0A238JVH7_9RHOB|nr:hypothetical protein [Actibacterium lipolyticum]SMX34650.1 hypothetical protein COL8621_01418 [Actibacterium lipolyticum]